MKSFVNVFALVLLLGSTVFAQGFYSVSSTDGSNVWAVGKSGLVFRSTDGGLTWSSFTQGSSSLYCVQTMGSTIWIAGQNGMFQKSVDGGASWTFETVNAGKTIRSVYFLNQQKGWIVGDSGSVMLTDNGGLTWASAPGANTETVQKNYYDVAFKDAQTGYLVGGKGTVMKSVDGGMTWNLVNEPSWGKTFLGVAVSGETVVVTSADGEGYRSTDGGTTWTSLKLNSDSQSDIADVFMMGPDSIVCVGGGGFIRQSINGGATWRWGQHGLHATLNSVFFYDKNRGWACGEKTNVVLRTTDGGLTWLMPTGTTVNYVWNQKMSAGASIGNTMVINPLDKKKLYVALGRFIYMSSDLGETWSQTAVISPSSGSTHSFFISPKDTNKYVVAFTGGGDRVMYSSNRGLTWSSPIIREFSSYGMPLELDETHPDTLIFGPEDGYVYISTNFGASWSQLGYGGFNSPCDLHIVRDSSNIMWVGDSGPSRISRSTNGGVNWSLMLDGGSSEIPTIANSNMQNNMGFATMWGSGGVQKTTNYGATWTTTATTGSAWGVDVSKDDPNVVMFGVYGGGQSYLSTNAGATFTSTPLTGSNYAILAYDRGTFFAQQSGGIHRMNITYSVPVSNSQILSVVAPNGGEQWTFGTTKLIRWTSSNVTNLKIDYRTATGQPWQSITNSVPATQGSYSWQIPNTPATDAQVRISDASDANPLDSSNAAFSILVASITTQPSYMNFGDVQLGTSRVDTFLISNPGTAPLVVSNASTGSAFFTVGRSSFTIAPGASDTLSVTFSPYAIHSYEDTLRLTTNTPSSTLLIPLAGNGSTASAVEETEVPTTYVLEQNYPNPFNPKTTIRYEIPNESFVTLRVFNPLGQEIATLVNGVRIAGRYAVEFPSDGGHLPSGIYFYKLQAGDFVSQRKMLLIK